MQKLKNDEDDIIAEKAMKQERKGKDFQFMYKITYFIKQFGFRPKTKSAL